MLSGFELYPRWVPLLDGWYCFRVLGILRGLKRSQHTNEHNKTLKGECFDQSCVNRTETVHGILRLFPVFISPIVWNMCEHLHYESVYFKELRTQRARILLTDNIQSGGSCSVNYY